MRRKIIIALVFGLLCGGLLLLWGRATAQSDTTAVPLDGKTAILCSFPGGGLPYDVSISPYVKASVRQIVTEVAISSGLRPNFYVAPGNVPNAAAGIGQGPNGLLRVIVYNQEWMDTVARRTRTDWASYSIIAHEIGHHLQGHTIVGGGSHPSIELEADEFSGFMMARMGGTLAQAQIAIRTLASEAGSSTHPPRRDRLAAIARGWERAKAQGGAAVLVSPQPQTSEGQDLPPAPARETPLQEATATTCVAPLGDCRLSTPTPVGAECACPSPIGMLPGVAH
jgi:hypothetical protein